LSNQVYTRYINRKHFRSGRLWQNRFFSCIVDAEDYLWTVARYVENNPVKAGLVNDALDYKWSSARCHLLGAKDNLLRKSTWLANDDKDDYRMFLKAHEVQVTHMINQATRSGRPLCNAEALAKLERHLGRKL
jgi:putative transposase